MKKIYLYAGLLATSLAFTACSDDYTDWANPQAWSQEAQQNAIKGTIKASVESLNIAEIGADGVALIDFVGAENATEDSKVRFASLKLNDAIDVPFTTSGNQLVVTAAALSNALQECYNSLECAERTCKFTVDAALVNKDGVAAVMPIEANEVTIKIKTKDVLPSISKEEKYYYVGGYNGWNLAEPTAMKDNGDGTYSCIIELGAGSEWFAFAPQSAVDSQNWNSLFRANTNGDTSTSGFFNLDITSGNSFCAEIEKAGKYKFTINPKAWTYSYSAYVESAYYAGDANGWSFSPLCKVGDSFVGYYYIYQPDNASTWGFKVTSAANWDEAQYGAGASEGTIAAGGGNIQITEPSGFYQLSVNTDNGTYSISAISNMSLIGSAIGDNAWSDDLDLTFNLENKAWEGTYTVKDGEFKIRANHDWTLSWGGSLEAMTSQNGANLSITAGTYKFSFVPNCDGQGVLTITAQ